MILQGEATLSVTTWACRRHDPVYEWTSSVRDQLAVRAHQVGMDVLLAVGILRYGLNLQREEIQRLLDNRGIHLSDGTISGLSDEFLVRWRLFFEEIRTQLAPRLTGLVLLIDGTQDRGGRVTYRALDAKRSLTLHAETFASENEEDLVKFLEHVRRIYPTPRAIIRDMSSAAKAAIDRVYPGIPQQVCHLHFLRAIGDTLLGDPHKELRKLVLATQELAHLTAIARVLARTSSQELCAKNEKDVMRDALHVWARLLIEHVDHPRQSRADSPFNLPYLSIMQRLREGDAMLTRVLASSNRANLCDPTLLDIKQRVTRILQDPAIKNAFLHLERLKMWFNDIRKLMRLERADLSAQTHCPTLARRDRDAIQARVLAIRHEASQEDERTQQAWQRIVHKFDAHSHELWVNVRAKSMTRVNNALEGEHRALRRGIRRRTGRKETAAEMERTGDHLSYWSNASTAWFQRHALKGRDLRATFLQQDQAKVNTGLATLRQRGWKNRLPVRASQRQQALGAFVDLFEKPHDSHALSEWARTVRGSSLAV